MKNRIPYGVREGKIVYIDEIASHESGRRCCCFCDFCGYPLIAVVDSIFMQSHFKHAKGHKHCNYSYDEKMFSHVYKLLIDLEPRLADLLMSDDLELFSVKGIKIITREQRRTLDKNTKSTFSKPDSSSILFKIIIEGREFKIRISSKKSSISDKKELRIFIGDLISSKDALTQQRINEIINEILIRLNRATKGERIETVEKEPKNIIVEQSISDTKIESKDEYEVEQDNLTNVKKENDFSDTKIRNGFCPICKSGRVVERVKKHDNKPFFGCSRFPKCTYKLFDITYYDYDLSEWIDHSMIKQSFQSKL